MVATSLVISAGVYGASANTNQNVVNENKTESALTLVEQDLVKNFSSPVVFATTPVETDFTFHVASFSWDKTENESDLVAQVCFQQNQVWSDWFSVAQGNSQLDRVEENSGKEISEPVFAGDGATAYQVSFVSSREEVLQNPKINIVDSGNPDAGK